MPFDTVSPAARPFMREGTAALAALVATRPARDVLVSVAAELAHRDRPAAKRLAGEVAGLLGAGAASVTASERPAKPRISVRAELRETVAAPPASQPVEHVARELGTQLPPGVFRCPTGTPAEMGAALEAMPYGARVVGLPGETLPRSRRAAARILRVPGFEHAAEVVDAARAKQAAKRAGKPVAVGSSPKQRAAWAALSPERQAHMRALATWREAWGAWRYHGGAEPGTRPVDRTSPEAVAMMQADRRNREWDAWREAEHAAALAEGRAWRSSEARQVACLHQPAGRYTGNPAADARLNRAVTRWMRAARIMSGKLEPQAFRERMARSKAARERVAKVRAG